MHCEPVPMPRPLPRLVDPYPTESATGFCLRALALQGLNLHWLRRTAGMPYGALPTQAYWRQIGAVFEPAADWLLDALPVAHGTVPRAWVLCGHQFLSANQLRLRWPQLCLMCLAEQGYCQAIWDVSLLTVCGVHGWALVDRCAACARVFTWDRPGISRCMCRALIARAARDEAVQPLNVLEQAIMGHLQGAHAGRKQFHGAALPDWLGDLSLDGLLCVTHAFGELQAPHQKGLPSVLCRSMSTPQWRAVMSRAVARLKAFARPDGQYIELGASVSRSILQRLLRVHCTPGDLDVACMLHATLYRDPTPALDGRPAQQLELFP